jgi:CheY-like chemotaxis protein/DNA-directed RNA polymerase specialized sigma24 family protein
MARAKSRGSIDRPSGHTAPGRARRGSLLARLAPHLPYLRRYACAITGDRTRGDDHVRLTLNALADSEQPPKSSMSPRVALYHAFHQVSAAPLSAPSQAQLDQPDDAYGRLARISPMPRFAFLLTAVEGFTQPEAANILSTSLSDAEKLICEAQREIDAELATDVLIIEDEPVVAADIEWLVKELGHSVTDIAATRTGAIDSVGRQPPGLVLADIALADGSSGVDAVMDILQRLDVPVIFITAFPERLLTGERPEMTYVITKPFQPETLKAHIGQALFFHPGSAVRPRLSQSVSTTGDAAPQDVSGEARATVPAADRFVKIDHNSEAYAHAVEALDEVEKQLASLGNAADADTYAHIKTELAAGRALFEAAVVNSAAVGFVLGGALTAICVCFHDFAISFAAGAALSLVLACLKKFS